MFSRNKKSLEDRAAMDEVVQMMGGLAYMTGPGQPLRAGTSVNDIIGRVFGALAVIAALYERERTGEGQLVRSSLFENKRLPRRPEHGPVRVTGHAARPMPVRLSAWAVYEVFDAADDEKIFIGVVSDTQWTAFCLRPGRPRRLGGIPHQRGEGSRPGDTDTGHPRHATIASMANGRV
jgi:crotonobetainyl-CoA:carnitine CoA-transferase CaiB-like acyl-CoA transferase